MGKHRLTGTVGGTVDAVHPPAGDAAVVGTKWCMFPICNMFYASYGVYCYDSLFRC